MDERTWLNFLTKASGPRPLLVQHDKKDVWHIWPCDHTAPIYTRNLIPNEVLFECDSPPANEQVGWAAQRKELLVFVDFLNRCRIPFVLSYSGNKSFHIHVFFSVPWIESKDELGMFAARITLFKELPYRAKVALAFDRSNMSWYDLERKGRMVREFLSVKEGSTLPKTWISDIPEERPAAYHARFPSSLPEFWDASIFRPEIDTTAAESNKLADRKVTLLSYTPDKDWRLLISSGWLISDVLWDPGTRYIRGRTSGRAMYTAGLSIEEA